jgi:hypothetical protein
LSVPLFGDALTSGSGRLAGSLFCGVTGFASGRLTGALFCGVPDFGSGRLTGALFCGVPGFASGRLTGAELATGFFPGSESHLSVGGFPFSFF